MRLAFNKIETKEQAKEQFGKIVDGLKELFLEQMKTDEGREDIRRSVAGMRGVPTSMVKFESEK